MKQNHYKRNAILAGLSFVGLSGLANAQEEEEIIQLDPYEVKAESEPGDLAMDALQIERLQANDLAELFSNQSTLSVGGGSAVAQKIYVRGFEDTMLNVTIDGAQQIGELYHHQGRLQLEPEFIKTIDLDAGAGAATSGAGALTGSMRVTLKDAFDMLGEERVGAFVKTSYGFNGEDSYKLVGSAYGKLTDSIGLIATYSHAEGEDYADGNGDIVTPTAYNHARGYVKLNGTGATQNWSLAYEALEDTGTYYERPHMIGFNAAYVLSDHEMNRETLTFNHQLDAGDGVLDLNSTLYWTQSDYSNHRNTTGALYGRGEFESLGFDIRNNMISENNGLTFGIDYREDKSDSEQNATPPTFWGTSTQSATVFGIYAQDDWQATEVITLSAGLRYDNYERVSEEGVAAGASNESDGFSPNASVTWQATEDLSFRAGYSRAFRGITIREAFFSALYVHDGDLSPEKADNIEFGFAWEKDGTFLRGTVYTQDIENYIDAEYSGGEVWGYWRNVGTAEVDGYELELGQHYEKGFVSVGVWNADNSFNDEALTDANLGLGTSIGRTWNAKANYFLSDYNVDLGLFARYVESEENAIAADAPDKPSYFVTDLFASWSPVENDALTLSASIKNVFDEFYYDHGTYGYNARVGSYIGFPARGREISLTASYKF
ncbi:TonB-dependent receptor domain-containing protein [Pelagicoccus albus]|uniref:TonB-dependent receptor n=1 Tax=Pelagicoccus albus TaxID=415222 RepID=A0A7X1B511_9BACT|nr:TonB-dependent receptor [Pelagicoccus albus]MBC2605756.1 TonB-dependent receptor [Pelagicoccus albus]